MRYCQKCLMPDTRPGLTIDNDGVCQACKNHEKKSEIDWDQRLSELERLCDTYRRDDGYYDCIIPVSGGKDSHYLTYVMVEKMDMNPLLISVADPFSKTHAGVHNLENLEDTFDCDHVSFNISRDTFRKATRIGFEKMGEPLRFVEAAIYTVPIKYASRLDIPLLVYGENGAFEFGTTDEESKSATPYIRNTFDSFDLEWWLDQDGINETDLNPVKSPPEHDLKETDPIFMSYFRPWDGYRNYRIAQKYGFKTAKSEWDRPGHIEDYDQIDSIAYIVHNWMKYPKFGFMRATDIAARWVRTGRITRTDAKRLIKKHGGILDERALDDFIDFTGYTRSEFYDIVEDYWNEDIFEYDERSAEWQLKDPVYANFEEDDEL